MRRLSEKSLTNAALHYLKRYAASKKGLARVLERKVKRHVRREGGDASAALPLIAPIVERMVRLGYVDDERLAESKAWSLHRQGKGARMIRLKLKLKGLEPDVIARHTPSSPEHEQEAAATLVKKKKLGHDPERRQRDLGVLVRAGFGYGTASKALQAVAPLTSSSARQSARRLNRRGSFSR